MSSNHETSETFTERVDVTTQPDRAVVGTLEIDARSDHRHQEQAQALQEECDRLRDRVKELEHMLTEARQ